MKRAHAMHVILLLFTALALRLSWLVGPSVPLGGDEGAYHALAVRLSDGRGFVAESGAPTAWRTPGLPGFLSLVYRATRPDPPVARVVLAVFTSLTPGLQRANRSSLKAFRGPGPKPSAASAMTSV